MKILGYNIPIIMTSDNLGSSNAGSWSFPKGEIRVDKNLKSDIADEVKLHEVIEAINGTCDLQLEHRKLSTLSAILYQVFVDNGNIADWETEEE